MERINLAFAATFPNNCSIIVQTEEGVEVGTCTYYAPNGICPRHGDIKERVQQAIDAQLDRVGMLDILPFTDPTPATSEDDTAAYHGQERAV